MCAGFSETVLIDFKVDVGICGSEFRRNFIILEVLGKPVEAK